VRVRVDKFCSLSTSPSWQAWLFHFDQGVYRKFIKKLQASRGCDQNKELMIDLLKEIETIPQGNDKLLDFLTKHYPYMLVDDEGRRLPRQQALAGLDDIFEHYNPDILTYPRRFIITGAAHELNRKVKEFLLDKIQSDYVIVGDRAYIEYLKKEDASVKEQIPMRNWRIAAWRSHQESQSQT
jgi:hypothetical protein